MHTPEFHHLQNALLTRTQHDGGKLRKSKNARSVSEFSCEFLNHSTAVFALPCLSTALGLCSTYAHGGAVLLTPLPPVSVLYCSGTAVLTAYYTFAVLLAVPNDSVPARPLSVFSDMSIETTAMYVDWHD